MEGVYSAARANLRRLMGRYPRLPAPAVCSGGGHVAGMGQEMEKAFAGGRPGGYPGAAQSLASASVKRWLSASSRCVTLRQRACNGRRGPRPSCTTCPAIPICKQSGCHAPAGRSTASCSKPDASPTGCPTCKRSLHALRR